MNLEVQREVECNQAEECEIGEWGERKPEKEQKRGHNKLSKSLKKLDINLCQQKAIEKLYVQE